jgi:hypothetical protein
VAQPPFEVTREQKQKIGKLTNRGENIMQLDGVVFLLLSIAIAIAIAIKSILTNESN